MAAGQLSKVIQHLRIVLETQDSPGMTDGELLKNYVHFRDEAAFETLVRRHGPMVFGVCQRVLHHLHDAEDAFQATFLVLVSKASSLRSPAMLGNWLYGVAYRTALHARTSSLKRRAKEAEVTPRTQPRNDIGVDLRPALELELAFLPDKYRAAIVLCDLEGKTRKEAARELNWSEGTVASRLARGRVMLAKRLVRHGLNVSGGALAAVLSQSALACVPTSVVASTIKAAGLFAAGQAPPKIAALTQGVLKTMMLTKLKTMILLAGALSLITVTLGVSAYDNFAPQSVNKKKSDPGAVAGRQAAVTPQAEGKSKTEPKPKVLALDGSMSHMAWSSDGKVIASVGITVDVEEKNINGEKKKVYSGTNSTVKFWDVERGELRLSLGEEKKVRIQSIVFSPDGKTLAVAAHDAGVKRVDPFEVRLVDTETGRVKKTIPHPGTVRILAFSPNGKFLAIGGQYLPEKLTGPFVRTVQLWDIDKEKVTADFKQTLDLTQQQIESDGYLDGLRDLAFSPDSKLLATADVDYKLRLLDVQTGQAKKTMEGHTGVILAVRFSPNGKTLVSASVDGRAKVWDVNSGELLKTLERNNSRVWTVAFSPDGKLLATGGLREQDSKSVAEVVLWDTQSWEAKPVSPREIGEGLVRTVAFSPSDGKTLAIGRAGKAAGEIKLWPVANLPTEDK
jgi:RNA polymerase sigma factor (sigma-70 family)